MVPNTVTQSRLGTSKHDFTFINHIDPNKTTIQTKVLNRTRLPSGSPKMSPSTVAHSTIDFALQSGVSQPKMKNTISTSSWVPNQETIPLTSKVSDKRLQLMSSYRPTFFRMNFKNKTSRQADVISKSFILQ